MSFVCRILALLCVLFAGILMLAKCADHADAQTSDHDIRALAHIEAGVICDTPEQMAQLLVLGPKDENWDEDIAKVNATGANCAIAEWAFFLGDVGPQVRARGSLWEIRDVLVVGKNGTYFAPVKRAAAFEVDLLPGEDI